MRGDLGAAFETFWQGVEAGSFAPRQMILQRLGLEDRARAYLKLADKYGSFEATNAASRHSP